MPQDFRTARLPAETIGFHELRQACEISALREDLERLVQGTDGLRGQIEDAVEQVRTRFAALTPEQLADSNAMAPLLQFAVAHLIAIREKARALSTSTGAVPDDARTSWSAATAPTRGPDTRPPPQPAPQASPGRPAAVFAEPAVPAAPPPPAALAAAAFQPVAAPQPMAAPLAAPPVMAVPPSGEGPPAAVWLAPANGPTAAARARAAQRPMDADGPIDWLRPAPR